MREQAKWRVGRWVRCGRGPWQIFWRTLSRHRCLWSAAGSSLHDPDARSCELPECATAETGAPMVADAPGAPLPIAEAGFKRRAAGEREGWLQSGHGSVVPSKKIVMAPCRTSTPLPTLHFSGDLARLQRNRRRTPKHRKRWLHTGISRVNGVRPCMRNRLCALSFPPLRLCVKPSFFKPPYPRKT